MSWESILKSPYRVGGEAYEYDRSPKGKEWIEELNSKNIPHSRPFPNITYSKLYHGFQGDEIKNIEQEYDEELEEYVEKYFSPNIYQSAMYAFLGWHESDHELRFKDKGKPRLIQLLPKKEMVNLDFDSGIMGLDIKGKPKKEGLPASAIYRTKDHDKLDFKEVPSNRVKALALDIIEKLENNDSKTEQLLADTQEQANNKQAINHIKSMLKKYF